MNRTGIFFLAQSGSDYANGSPPPSLAGATKYQEVSFLARAKEEGSFHGRSQSLTEPNNVCRFARTVC